MPFTKEDIIEQLKGIVHPEQQKDIVSLGMVESLSVTDTDIRLVLRLNKARDPMATSLRRAAEAVIAQHTGLTPTVIVNQGAAPDSPQAQQQARKEAQQKAQQSHHIDNIIAVASGKGGVGKSTVTANLAVALAAQGYRVGIIDADIYGPSMPKMFGVEDYQPVAEVSEDGSDVELIIPAQSHGVKVMSIGFFISSSDALMWRGPMATNALKQLLHQTAWGELDYLLIDLPPGTGDLHLTIISELKIDGAIIVSTPQQVAMIDVVRGIAMFRNENIGVPILGLVENMAWFTPAELPDNKYYIFGHGGVEALAAKEGVPLLAQIPLVQSISEGSDTGSPIALGDSVSAESFYNLARSVVAATAKK